ncbi:hypothetical protein KZA77_001865 [Streptococcus constellatus]|uniref:hypothetical protein n=1 Tax=Streptococcus constellatus TaxID=76860 RepID=UPI001C5972FE|nr:hypothetical protein [Streptococcus constellatus]MBW3452045.1 hypothetical protein [Streptococcus constellatus]
MDQERATHTMTLKGKMTAEVILKALYVLSKELYDRHEYKQKHQTFTGETNFNRFMATSSYKDSFEFKNSESHLEKLKHYLNEKGVGFTYQIQKDETQLIFEAKNKALVRAALDQIIEEITKKPEEFVKRVLKKPHEMKPQEKIAYYKKHIQYKGMMPAVTKDIGKELEK